VAPRRHAIEDDFAVMIPERSRYPGVKQVTSFRIPEDPESNLNLSLTSG